MAALAALRKPGKEKFWRLILLIYVAGLVLDIGWHFAVDLTTGDHEIETYDWVSAFQASLFWPLDLAAQAILALR
jgi:hypothetical protein